MCKNLNTQGIKGEVPVMFENKIFQNSGYQKLPKLMGLINPGKQKMNDIAKIQSETQKCLIYFFFRSLKSTDVKNT